jgi:hypothetical protein
MYPCCRPSVGSVGLLSWALPLLFMFYRALMESCVWLVVVAVSPWACRQWRKRSKRLALLRGLLLLLLRLPAARRTCLPSSPRK